MSLVSIILKIIRMDTELCPIFEMGAILKPTDIIGAYAFEEYIYFDKERILEAYDRGYYAVVTYEDIIEDYENNISIKKRFDTEICTIIYGESSSIQGPYSVLVVVYKDGRVKSITPYLKERDKRIPTPRRNVVVELENLELSADEINLTFNYTYEWMDQKAENFYAEYRYCRYDLIKAELLDESALDESTNTRTSL